MDVREKQNEPLCYDDDEEQKTLLLFSLPFFY